MPAAFIDFEGIDGSGKTTLSNRVADRLRASGIEVVHARAGGELPSGIARRIRALTRDGSGTALTPEAELLLNAAREAQILAEAVRPALARGAVVIGDRSLDAHLAMACARGLPPECVRPVLDLAAGGTWADLVVLVDVDPEIARLRKRAGKLDRQETEPPGRKSLAGPALLHRMRAALRELAAREPDRFLVFTNEGEDLAALEDAIVAAILARLRPRARRRSRGAPAQRRLPSSPPAEPAPLALPDPAALEARFLAAVRRWGERDPAGAAMLLGGVGGPGALALRRRLAASAPSAVAGSLCATPTEGIEILEALAERAPGAVAKALVLRQGARADALRLRLAGKEPRLVALSLLDRHDDYAWALRERLWATAPEEVLASLGGDDSDRGWALRERALVEKKPADAIHLSLARLDGDRAWAWRSSLEASPPALLRGIRSCADPRAWAIRSRWLEAAPRPVLKGMVGLDVPEAWALRWRAGSGAVEVLDSIAGMACGPARALRAGLAPIFPARALLSLPPRRERADERLLREVVARYGGHLLVLRAAVRVLGAGTPRREAAA